VLHVYMRLRLQVRELYKAMRVTHAVAGAGTGGGMFGEATVSTMQRMCHAMKKVCSVVRIA
jgi:hypothetical protein